MHSAGLRESAQFLAMAKLQLQLDLNGVTDGEFRALCDALEGKALATPSGSRAGRARRALAAMATCATMRRAWHCPQDATARRAGRRRAARSSDRQVT